MRVLVACAAYRLWARSYLSGLRLEWDEPLPVVYITNGNTGSVGRVVFNKLNLARDIALAAGYDALLTVEDDMVVPPDGLKMLAGVDADIVYGLYIVRHGSPVWSAYSVLNRNGGKSLSRDPEAAQAAWGSVVEVAGVGHGFTLIRRSFLERFAFRLEGSTTPDWWMAWDAQQAGLKQMCHTGVVCGHITDSPRRILWPDAEAPGLYREERW